MLCGTTLQFAFQGIKLFSDNKHIPKNFTGIIKPNSAAEKFCIGRLVDEIPIGLIIYAGRNQAMHFDDVKLKEPSNTIFSMLGIKLNSGKTNKSIDTNFNTNNDNIVNYAEEIVYKLQWFNYNSYEKDLMSIFAVR